ncbi:MAG: hypothetical protein JO353_13045 [Phycisphaerae bacterium]|nr:hypothetical protein [Phycisphaerae bacterium]
MLSLPPVFKIVRSGSGWWRLIELHGGRWIVLVANMTQADAIEALDRWRATFASWQ